jgi:hypothetical protein
MPFSVAQLFRPSLTRTLLFLVSVLFSGFAFDTATAAPRFDGRVIVKATEYPWSALGRVNAGGRSYCTGTLISERHVLTEARCLFYDVEGRWWDPSELHFVAGYERDRYAVNSPVVRYDLAPGYDGGDEAVLSNVTNNWAILTLRRPIGRAAGWVRLQRLDEDALARLESGEAYVLEAGYRRGQPHVITVSLDCGLRSLARQELRHRGICRALNVQPGLSRLLYIDDEFRVLAPQSMQSRRVRQGSASVPALVDQFMPRQTLDGVLDGLGYADASVAPAGPLDASVMTLASVFGAALRESGLRNAGDLEVALTTEVSKPPATAPPVATVSLPAPIPVAAPGRAAALALAPIPVAAPGRAAAPAPTLVRETAPTLAAVLVSVSAPAAASQRGASGVPAPSAASTLFTYRTAAATRDDPPLPAARPAAGAYVVQLASFTTRPVAAHASAMLQERYADILGSLDVFVQSAFLADRGQVFRVRTGPYATLQLASETCRRIRARNYDCLVMKQSRAGSA